MSGLAPMAVFLSAAAIGATGMLWLASRILKWSAARIFDIAFAGVTAICIGYLAIDKFVGVGYTKGFYMSLALFATVGVLSGLALRRAR